jgi:two-component system, NarL family, invasion response regulator UvrY
MDEKKKIILVDDHVIVRNGLRELIEKIGPYKIVDEFDNGESLLQSLPLKETPDLLVLDLNLPGMHGDRVMEELNAKKFKAPVLILTLNTEEPMIIKLFRAGVRGYLAKNCSATVLRSALDEIFRNGYYHNEFLAMSLRQNSKPDKKTVQEQILEQLTAREKEFLALVCHESELTYEQIAEKMHVQHRTVDGYRESIFEKFGIRSKTGLVLFVLKHQLFEFIQG